MLLIFLVNSGRGLYKCWSCPLGDRQSSHIVPHIKRVAGLPSRAAGRYRNVHNRCDHRGTISPYRHEESFGMLSMPAFTYISLHRVNASSPLYTIQPSQFTSKQTARSSITPSSFIASPRFRPRYVSVASHPQLPDTSLLESRKCVVCDVRETIMRCLVAADADWCRTAWATKST